MIDLKDMMKQVNAFEDPANKGRHLAVNALTDSINFMKNILGAEVKTIGRKIGKLDKMEQDALHVVEFKNFNAANGYKLAKLLKVIRTKKRAWKTRLRYVQTARHQILDCVRLLKESKHDNIKKIDNILNNAHYNFKELCAGEQI